MAIPKAPGTKPGMIFVTAGLIDEEQLDMAINKQKQMPGQTDLGKLLVDMGLISDRQRVQCQADMWGIPYLDLSKAPPDAEIARLLSQSVARQYKAIPVALEGRRITVAMVNPLDIYATDEIRLITGKDVEPVFATEEDILNAISATYRDEVQMSDVLTAVVADLGDATVSVEDVLKPEEEEGLSLEQLREMGEVAPVVRLSNMMIADAIREKASDIHVEPGKDAVKVRYRIDGVLRDMMAVPKQVQASLTSRLKIMASMDIAEKRVPQDGRISISVDGRHYDLRVNTLPSIYGEKIVLRILDRAAISVDFHKLGMLQYTLDLFEQIISRPYGIILVTGPTGSGKSTTLYSVLSRLNTGDRNILTIEDPVEYELTGLTQVNVNLRAEMTFAAGLRAMMRQDPDIIMVGEIRDRVTATIAVEAALTGHLVLSTLHTNDAPGAVARLIEMGVEPFLIASSLIGVMAQRLVRTICPKCKVQYEPDREALYRVGFTREMLEGQNGDAPPVFYRGEGCDFCKRSGYKGRVGIYELMPVPEEMREMILRREPTDAIRATAVKAGMYTLKHDMMQKILLGITTLEESIRVIYSG